jgi:acyl-CoA hydrolase
MATENYRLVLPEHLNQWGHLFGGYLLQWVDESAWIAATLDYPGCRFVTIGMDKVEFRQGVKEGAILRVRSERVRQGRTSVQYRATVSRVGSETGAAAPIFSTNITFVRVDEHGGKTPLP